MNVRQHRGYGTARRRVPQQCENAREKCASYYEKYVLPLLGDAAAGGPVAAVLAQVHPASLLGGALLVAPLALRRRYVSSSNTPVPRRSAKGSRSTSE